MENSQMKVLPNAEIINLKFHSFVLITPSVVVITTNLKKYVRILTYYYYLLTLYVYYFILLHVTCCRSV